jgi:transposase InsO family protein
MSDKYAAITAHQDRFPVRLMCRALGVSVGGYYAARHRPASARAQADERLRVHVRAAHRKSRGRYGAPRILEELKAEGITTSEKRVARLMREDGLVARPKRRFVVTTDSAHTEPVAPNLLARRFALAAHPTPDRAWVGDLTYIPTREGWLYLAVLLDLTTRRVVGWATGATLETALPLAALRQALAERRPAAGLIAHSDRGSQYASQAYRAVLAAHGAVQSMSRKGDCWDNAVAESFFSTLEHELLDDADFHSRHEAQRAIFEFIEVWYNRQRRHSTLGYVSPVQYERQLGQSVVRAA